MLAADHPLATLTTLAHGRVSGELIASSSRGETHVYLVLGRLAWATDSRRPQGFAGQLQRTAGIAAETLREVADECRRGALGVAGGAPSTTAGVPATAWCVETHMDHAPPSLVSDERQAWCFGARLVGDGARSVWLDRNGAQGLGWAYLAALTRSLASTTSTRAERQHRAETTPRNA